MIPGLGRVIAFVHQPVIAGAFVCLRLCLVSASVAIPVRPLAGALVGPESGRSTHAALLAAPHQPDVGYVEFEASAAAQFVR